MNDILNELITEIMSLGEAKNKPANPAAKKPDKSSTPVDKRTKAGETWSGEKIINLPAGLYVKKGGNVYADEKSKDYRGRIRVLNGQSTYVPKEDDAGEVSAKARQAAKQGQQKQQVTQPQTQPPVDVQQTIGD